MTLKSIQLATISPINRAEGKFEVTVHSDDGNQIAEFDCDSEHDAIVLRNAIREHASRLRHVADYRPRKSTGSTTPELLEALRDCEEELEYVRRYVRDARGGNVIAALEKARAAIAKATGSAS